MFQSLKWSAFAYCPYPPPSHFCILSWSLCVSEVLSKNCCFSACNLSHDTCRLPVQINRASIFRRFFGVTQCITTKEHCSNLIWPYVTVTAKKNKKSPVYMFHLCYSLSNVFILSVYLQKKDAGEGVYEVFLLCCGCLILSVVVEFTFLVLLFCISNTM